MRKLALWAPVIGALIGFVSGWLEMHFFFGVVLAFVGACLGLLVFFATGFIREYVHYWEEVN